MSFEPEEWDEFYRPATQYLFFPDFAKWCATPEDRSLLAWNQQSRADSLEMRDPLEWLK